MIGVFPDSWKRRSSIPLLQCLVLYPEGVYLSIWNVFFDLLNYWFCQRHKIMAVAFCMGLRFTFLSLMIWFCLAFYSFLSMVSTTLLAYIMESLHCHRNSSPNLLISSLIFTTQMNLVWVHFYSLKEIS